MIETACRRLIAVLACAAVGVFPLDAAEVPGKQKLQFGQHVHPILAAHCTACHGAAAPAAELDLTTEASLMKGSVHGPVVIPGAPEKSVLFHKISNRNMPPPGMGTPLTAEQIEIIRKWMDASELADDVDPQVAEVPADPKTPEVSEEDRKFWAFQTPVKAPLPRVKKASLVRTGVDAFVLAKLESKGLTFSKEASKLTLMRRAYFDLIGLPPSPHEVREFLADKRRDAYERLIDRLLDSPHYGERWGRHWLDVAGYTDEKGFANDLGIVMVNEGMWRYRDYVVRSFNNDKPYDRFISEQLAGDELVDWRNAEKYTPEIRDALIATGYLRTMQDLTDAGAVNRPLERSDVLFRVVDHVGSGLLGLTVGCARCHSHKYDPIPQRDYYRLSAVFTPAYNLEEWTQPKDRVLPDVSKAEQEKIERHNAEIDRPLGELTKQLEKIRGPYRERLFEQKLKDAVPEHLREDVRVAFEIPDEERTVVQKYLFTKLEGALTVSPAEIDSLLDDQGVSQFAGLPGQEKAKSAKLQQRIETLKGWRRSFNMIHALWDTGEPPTTHLMLRGNIETPGPPVEPGFLTVLSKPGQSGVVPVAGEKTESSGRRLALARWMTSRDHPLTARVMVNRTWEHHFGKGIVGTAANFGRLGSRPTHPELLDWLAVDFVENGWKIKRLHKLIMTSTVYRQSSGRPAGDKSSLASKIDPGNDLLWRMNFRRLEAEVMRDSILAVSGKLDRTLGGPPIMLDGAADGLVTVSEEGPTATSRFRRSLYLMARRNYSLSLLDVFDFPIMNLNTTQRTESATPLQSLTLLNSEFVMERAQDFADRLNELAGGGAAAEKKIEMAYLMALARRPSPEEAAFSAQHLDEQAQGYLDVKSSDEQASYAALASLGQMLMASNEFLYVD